MVRKQFALPAAVPMCSERDGGAGLPGTSVSDSDSEPESESEKGRYSPCLVTTWMAAPVSEEGAGLAGQSNPLISLIFRLSKRYSTKFSGILYFMVVDGCGP